MKTSNMVLGVIEAVFWYGTVYYTLYSIKNDVNLFVSAFIIIILVYAAGFSCPFVRSTEAWQKMWRD